MTLITKVLNNNLDNDIIFYSLLIGVVGVIGYSLISEIFSKSYMEKGVQTDAENNLSDTPNQIIQENLTSIDTLSPVSSTSSLIPTTSEVGIQTIPNPDIVGRVIDLSNAEYIAAKADQLNALDPFLATP
jgi:hypothetical protein